MPYTTIVAGTSITASWANASVRDQVVTPFATTGARDSAITVPVDGMLAAITGSDALSYYDGAAWNQIGPLAGWTTWTPTITQSSTPTKTTNDARYMRVGRQIIAYMDVAFTSAGTASNDIVCTLPVTARTMGGSPSIGSFRYFDAGNTNRVGTVIYASTTTAKFVYDGFGGHMGNTDFAIANTDTLSLVLNYEAAA